MLALKIVIDTIERIRDTELTKTLYSCDYKDITALREITDKHELTLLLIHHTRKMHDDDPLNTLSGSMGLVGAADGVLVLQKKKRIGNKAVLTITNRDTEEFCFDLEFDRESCRWIFKGNHEDSESNAGGDNYMTAKNEWLCLLVNDFLKEWKWSGTATELVAALNKIDGESGNVNLSHLTIKKQLMAKENAVLLRECGISVSEGRDSASRKIILERAIHCHSEETK